MAIEIIENRAGNSYNRFGHMLRDGAGKIFKIYTHVAGTGWLIEKDGTVVAQWDSGNPDNRVEHAFMLQDGADCLVLTMYTEKGWPLWGNKTFKVAALLTPYAAGSGEPVPTPNPIPSPYTTIKGPITIEGRVVITPE